MIIRPTIQINGVERLMTDEEYEAYCIEFAEREVQTAKVVISNQISALESQITVRRQREAILGTDNGWLANIDAQIAALREQLNAA